MSGLAFSERSADRPGEFSEPSSFSESSKCLSAAGIELMLGQLLGHECHDPGKSGVRLGLGARERLLKRRRRGDRPLAGQGEPRLQDGRARDDRAGAGGPCPRPPWPPRASAARPGGAPSAAAARGSRGPWQPFVERRDRRVVLPILRQPVRLLDVRLGLLTAPLELLVAAARAGRIRIDQGHRLQSLGEYLRCGYLRGPH